MLAQQAYQDVQAYRTLLLNIRDRGTDQTGSEIGTRLQGASLQLSARSRLATPWLFGSPNAGRTGLHALARYYQLDQSPQFNVRIADAERWSAIYSTLSKQATAHENGTTYRITSDQGLAKIAQLQIQLGPHTDLLSAAAATALDANTCLPVVGLHSSESDDGIVWRATRYPRSIWTPSDYELLATQEEQWLFLRPDARAPHSLYLEVFVEREQPASLSAVQEQHSKGSRPLLSVQMNRQQAERFARQPLQPLSDGAHSASGLLRIGSGAASFFYLAHGQQSIAIPPEYVNGTFDYLAPIAMSADAPSPAQYLLRHRDSGSIIQVGQQQVRLLMPGSYRLQPSAQAGWHIYTSAANQPAATRVHLYSTVATSRIIVPNRGEVFVIAADLEGEFAFQAHATLPLQWQIDDLPNYRFSAVGEHGLVLRRDGKLALTARQFPRAGLLINGQRFEDAAALRARMHKVYANEADPAVLARAYHWAERIDGLSYQEHTVAWDNFTGMLLGGADQAKPGNLGRLAGIDTTLPDRIVFRMLSSGGGFDTPTLDAFALCETIAAPGGTQRLGTHMVARPGGGISGERDFLFDLSHFHSGQQFYLTVHDEQFIPSSEYLLNNPTQSWYHWHERQRRARCIFAVPAGKQLHLAYKSEPDKHGKSIVVARILDPVSAPSTQTGSARAKRSDGADHTCPNVPSTSRQVQLRDRRPSQEDPLHAYVMPNIWTQAKSLQENIKQLQQHFDAVVFGGGKKLSSQAELWYRVRRKIRGDAERFFRAAPVRLPAPESPYPPVWGGTAEAIFPARLQDAKGIVLGVTPDNPYDGLHFVYENMKFFHDQGIRHLMLQSFSVEEYQAALKEFNQVGVAGFSSALKSALKLKDRHLMRITPGAHKGFQPYADTMLRARELGIAVHGLDCLAASLPNVRRPGIFTSGSGQSQIHNPLTWEIDAAAEAVLADLSISNYVFQKSIHDIVPPKEKFLAIVGEGHVNTLMIPATIYHELEKSAPLSVRSVPGLAELTSALPLQIQASNGFRDLALFSDHSAPFEPKSAQPLQTAAGTAYLSMDFRPASIRSIPETALRRSRVRTDYAILPPLGDAGYELIWRSEHDTTQEFSRAALSVDANQRWHIDHAPWRELLGASQYDNGFPSRAALEQMLQQQLRIQPVLIDFSDPVNRMSSQVLASRLKGSDYLRGSDLTNINLEGMELDECDLRDIDWKAVRIDPQTHFGNAIFNRASRMQMSWEVFDEVERLYGNLNQHYLFDTYFNHLANRHSGSLLLAIDSIADARLRVDIMSSLIGRIARTDLQLDLEPYVDSFVDILLNHDPAYWRDPLIAQLLKEKILPLLMRQAEQQVLATTRPLTLQMLAEQVQGRMSEANFVEQHSGLINQLIIHGQVSADATIHSGAIAQAQWELLPAATREMISSILDDRVDERIALSSHIRVISSSDGNLLLALPTARLTQILRSAGSMSADAWRNFAYFARQTDTAQPAQPAAYINLNAREKAMIGTDEVIFHRFPLIGRIYSNSIGQGRRLDFINSLGLPPVIHEDLIAATKIGKFNDKHYSVEQMSMLSDHFETLMLARATPGGRDLRLLQADFIAAVVRLYDLQNATPRERGALLFGLAAMLTHASSSSIFGTELDSPLPFRGLAAAFLNSAVELNPAILPDQNDHSIPGQWSDKLLGVECYGASCSGQISYAMRAQVLKLPKREQELFWQGFPLPWDH